jgi:uncharacterized OB-fold protein
MSDQGNGTIHFAIPGVVDHRDGQTRLIGSRCRVCGTHAFPKIRRCNNPRCRARSEDVDEALLGPHGTVWSWTTVRVPTPPPFRRDGSGPYAVAMVDLREGLRVIGQLDPGDDPRIGMPVELGVVPLFSEDGEPRHTWIWRPS